MAQNCIAYHFLAGAGSGIAFFKPTNSLLEETFL